MHDELTKIDIDQLKAELEERRRKVPALRDEVKRTKEYGDLSENDEYRCAKREYNRNKSRMRYLENMIETAVVIKTDSAADRVGLFDKVDIFYPEEEDEDEQYRTVRLVTTLRNDVLTDNISKESPFGKALMGHKVGETVIVHVNEKYSYPVKILKITKGEDDPDLKISSF
ncbi:MAG: GreA/GreB family elongation factor [Clostridia bacterium]|nr:GreA/GreB family elongation factor [Clostridia bacterium]